METAPVPREHENYLVDVSWPRGIVMHYVTHRYHRTQKHKFGVRYPDAFLWNP
jgi:hypothetical protein